MRPRCRELHRSACPSTPYSQLTPPPPGGGRGRYGSLGRVFTGTPLSWRIRMRVLPFMTVPSGFTLRASGVPGLRDSMISSVVRLPQKLRVLRGASDGSCSGFSGGGSGPGPNDGGPPGPPGPGEKRGPLGGSGMTPSVGSEKHVTPKGFITVFEGIWSGSQSGGKGIRLRPEGSVKIVGALPTYDCKLVSPAPKPAGSSLRKRCSLES